MIAPWMVYATGVAGLVGLGALALDRWGRPHRRPVRFAWAGAMILGAVLPVLAVRAEPVGALLLGLLAGPEGGAPARGVAFLEPLVVGASSGVLSAPLLDGALAGLWAIGSLGLVGWWLMAGRRLRSVTEGASASGNTDGRIVITPDVGPAVVGVFRPRILVPRWLAEGDPERLSLVLGHEREHVSAGDPALLSASFLVRVVFPWNPVLWWMARRLREAVEVDCDRRVLRCRPHALRRYADTLLAVSVRDVGPGAAGSVALAEPTSLLERRIRSMTASRPRHPFLRGVLLFGVALVALALACSAPSPEEAMETPTEPAVAADGVIADPGEVGGSGADPESLSELAEEPTFTPYAVQPELTNRSEVQRALEEEYPPLLREAGIGGVTTVWLLIDGGGRVQAVEINEPSGADPLDLAAIRVVRSMEFTPARSEGGDPVPVWISLPVTFVADRNPGPEGS